MNKNSDVFKTVPYFTYYVCFSVPIVFIVFNTHETIVGIRKIFRITTHQRLLLLVRYCIPSKASYLARVTDPALIVNQAYQLDILVAQLISNIIDQTQCTSNRLSSFSFVTTSCAATHKP